MGPRSDPSKIETSNLETHVLLCTERFERITLSVEDIDKKISEVDKHLLVKLETYTDKIEEKFKDYSDKIDLAIAEINASIATSKEKHNDMLLKWAVSIIATLVTIIGSLLFKIMPLIESIIKLGIKN